MIDKDSEIFRLRNRVAELEDRKCSHGDYRMIGTDDCKRWPHCGGRIEIYKIGEGLCNQCQNEQKNTE